MRKMQWRLIVSEFTSGAHEVALDEAILLRLLEGKSPPTVRLYASQREWVSIGAFQPALEDINTLALASRGLNLVRRPTGGGAVLHGNDLSYSMVAKSQDLAKDGGILGIYRALSSIICTSMQKRGLTTFMANPANSNRSSSSRGACFGSVVPYELLVGGRKVAGHAQRQKGEAFLLEGTLLMREGQARLAPLLNLPPGETSHMEQVLRRQSTCWYEEEGNTPSLADFASSLQEAFQQSLGISLLPGGPYPEEYGLASRLLDEKYASPTWNHRF